MSQTIAEAYRPTLAAIGASGLAHACIGTYGLYLHGVLPTDYALNDADVLVDVASPVLPSLFEALVVGGWRLYLWDERLEVFPDVETLRTHFYLRAKRGSLCLDLAFGGLPLAGTWIIDRAIEIGGLMVACRDDILFMKRNRGSAADRGLLDRLEGSSV